MPTDNYQIQNIYKYSRKTFKKNQRSHDDNPGETFNDQDETTDRNERIHSDMPGCSFEIDPDIDIASILHIKCPVISLAQQQIEKLLADDKLNNNTKCYRSLCSIICICKDFIKAQDIRCRCIILLLVSMAFSSGVLLGASTCGSYLGRFNSPIFACIDNYFISDKFPTIEDTFRSIV